MIGQNGKAKAAILHGLQKWKETGHEFELLASPDIAIIDIDHPVTIQKKPSAHETPFKIKTVLPLRSRTVVAFQVLKTIDLQMNMKTHAGRRIPEWYDKGSGCCLLCGRQGSRGRQRGRG